MALTSNSVSRKTIKILILITEAEAVEFTQDTRETAQDLDKRKLTCQSWHQMHLLSSLSLTTGDFGEAVTTGDFGEAVLFPSQLCPL